MPTDQPRRSAGTPAGGEFASKAHAEPATALEGAAAPDPLLDAVHAARDVRWAAEVALARADFDIIVSRVRATWPDAAQIRMHLGPDGDWGVHHIEDAEGNQLADWVEAGLTDRADVMVFVGELNDIGVMGRWVEAEEDSNEGVFRLDQPFDPSETPSKIVESPSGWSFRAEQENGDQVDCWSCGNPLDDDHEIVNDSEGFAYHGGCRD